MLTQNNIKLMANLLLQRLLNIFVLKSDSTLTLCNSYYAIPDDHKNLFEILLL